MTCIQTQDSIIRSQCLLTANVSVHVIPDTAILSRWVWTLFRLLWSLVDDDDKPVIIEATEATSKSFRQYLKSMKLRNYKKTAILGTAHILQKVLL